MEKQARFEGSQTDRLLRYPESNMISQFQQYYR
jgi:hypothetical protein